MVTGAIKIMDKYVMASIKEGIEIILDNYLNFLKIMDGFEESLRYLIIDGREMVKRGSRGDLGVRVRTSGLGDPTANAAADSVMLMEAIRSGNVNVELKGIECPEQYWKEVEVIREMKDNCSLVKAQVETPSQQGYRIPDSYLNGSHGLVKLAEEVDCTYNGIRDRLKRTRNHTRRSAAPYLEREYESD